MNKPATAVLLGQAGAAGSRRGTTLIPDERWALLFRKMNALQETIDLERLAERFAREVRTAFDFSESSPARGKR